MRSVRRLLPVVGTRVLQPSCSVRSVRRLLPVVGRPLIPAPAGGVRKWWGKAIDSCRGREKTAGEGLSFLPVAGENGGNFSLRFGRGTLLETCLFYGILLVGPTWATALFTFAGRGDSLTQVGTREPVPKHFYITRVAV
jgi:hypothetical protein